MMRTSNEGPVNGETVMIRAHQRAALILAIALFAGLAGPSHAAGETKGNAMTAQAAGNGAEPDTASQPTPDNMVVAPDELNDVDRALREDEPSPPPPARASRSHATGAPACRRPGREAEARRPGRPVPRPA